MGGGVLRDPCSNTPAQVRESPMAPWPPELAGEMERGEGDLEGTQPNGVGSELCNCDMWVTRGV